MEKAPAQYSPLAKKGVSLDTRTVDCSQGIMSNIDDYLRPAQKAKRIRNFHQFSRGMFSSRGGGWVRDAQSALNSGTDNTLGFGTYLDALGNSFLLSQVGNTLYNYDTVAHKGTAIAGMTALSTVARPCMRLSAPTQTTVRPFTIYCNGAIEPQKIFNTTDGLAPDTAATLGFDNGFRTTTCTIGGAINVGNTVTLTFTSTSLIVSPSNIVYTVLGTDTTSTVAAGLVALINAGLGTTSTVGIKATTNAAVMTITYPRGFGTTVARTVTGTITATLVDSSATPVFPGVFNTLTYTKPALCTPFASRMAYAKFATNGASGSAVANVLLLSGLGDAEGFPASVPPRVTDAFTIPIPPICGAPTALTSISLSSSAGTEVLFVGCQNGVCVLKGTDAGNFRMEIYTLGFGIPSNATFVQLDNALLFMATDGFRVYTGDVTTPNLLTSTISLDIYDQFIQVDKSVMDRCHAVHYRDTQEVWFWVPYLTDGGICKHAFILAYNTLDGNNIWYNIDNTSCNASIQFKNRFYGGTELGLIQRWYGVNNYDDISGNVSRQTVTVGGVLNIGGILSVTFTATPITGSPVTVSYTQVALDTTTTAAAGLVAAINANAALVGAGVSATNVANVVTIAYPTTLTIVFGQSSTSGFTLALAAIANTTNALNVLPGSEMIFSLVGVGNPGQFCSINKVVICAGAGDQKFLMNAASLEEMDNGATRQQSQMPINFTVASATAGQTVLAPASPNQWSLNSSAFSQSSSKFLANYVPVGHGRAWEFSIICNDTSHSCDFTSLVVTISIGGTRV